MMGKSKKSNRGKYTVAAGSSRGAPQTVKRGQPPLPRHRSRSPSRRGRHPVAHQNFALSDLDATELAASKLLASVSALTAHVGMLDCLRNFPEVCSNIDTALQIICEFMETFDGGQSGASSSEDASFRTSVELVFRALYSFHLVQTSNGLDFSPARAPLQRAWRYRARLFLPGELHLLESWVNESNCFREFAIPVTEREEAAAAPPPPHVVAEQPPDNNNNKYRISKRTGINAPDSTGRHASPPQWPAESAPTKHPKAGRDKCLAKGASARETLMQRNEQVERLLSQNKLCLVLDLDHTLLNSVMFSELDPITFELVAQCVHVENSSLPEAQRMLYRIDEFQMFTKLRPGVRRFLKRTSELFQLWVYTNGNAAYAGAVTRLLDPSGRLFDGRVIAQGSEDTSAMIDQPKFFLHGLETMESITLVVDDRHAVWEAHADNLLSVEPYEYFPSLRFPDRCGHALFTRGRDEAAERGMMALTLNILEKVHLSTVERVDRQGKGFRYNSTSGPTSLPLPFPTWDVRHVLREERQKVLAGVHVLFSRVIPLNQDPRTHELWRRAEAFGAVCGTELVVGLTTHVVSTVAGTQKVAAALAAGVHVVNPGWLNCSCTLWKRADEREFKI